MAEQTFTAGQILTATQMTTLQTNSGLCFVSSTSMSALSNPVNNCFTSTYTNYRIVINVDSSTASSVVAMRFRVGGVDNNTANYYFSATNVVSLGTTSVTAGNADTSMTLAYTRTVSFPTFITIDVCNPQATAKKMGTYNASGDNVGHTAWATQSGGFIFDATTSFDGFSIFTSSGTMTGTITVYGYRKQ